MLTDVVVHGFVCLGRVGSLLWCPVMTDDQESAFGGYLCTGQMTTSPGITPHGSN